MKASVTITVDCDAVEHLFALPDGSDFLEAVVRAADDLVSRRAAGEGVRRVPLYTFGKPEPVAYLVVN